MTCFGSLIRRDRNKSVQHRYGAITIFLVAVLYLVDANFALAAESQMNTMHHHPFPLSHVFTFLLLMLGLFKIIGPFGKLTKGASSDFIRQAALQSTLFCVLALVVAAIFGEMILGKYGIPLSILSLAVGVILFLVAILSIVQQFSPTSAKVDKVATTESATSVALTPLAFPTIVTPYGVGALVVFLALSPDLQGQVMIAAAVLGVVQVALGLQIANNSLKALGLI